MGTERPDAPWMVFLHEGLGSVAMWRDFPGRLCTALNCGGLVYSRPGYGRSSPRAPTDCWQPDFMHRQALEVLPAVVAALAAKRAQQGLPALEPKPWLFGHSDGGSIALLAAAHMPNDFAGAVVLAPHLMVEAFSLASIEKARDVYHSGSLRAGLAKYHDDPDSAFWGWNDVWLSPAFAAWDITQEITSITCPVLAIQGLEDEYGTLAHLDGITRALPQARSLTLADCGHSPHRDQPAAVIEAVAGFVAAHEQRLAVCLSGG